ncbi:hypothetical protein N0V88_002137 [Collariella sp. IMI 366227]|nr:hypothetical protein N0V88_002137 [Collariella sp. IMI 366227]
MKFTSLALAALSATAVAADYFFVLTTSTKFPSINNQRLRSNGSDTPGVTLAPYNPADHFNRMVVARPQDPLNALNVVPTNPHPPPVPGFYGLSSRDGVPDAYRLIYTYRPEDEGNNFPYQEWVPWYIKRSPSNEAVLATWDYDAVAVELVEAKGPVNSGAPGGVEE